MIPMPPAAIIVPSFRPRKPTPDWVHQATQPSASWWGPSGAGFALSRPGNGKRRQGDPRFALTDLATEGKECMDALKMLKEDHKRVKAMLSKLDETTEQRR